MYLNKKIITNDNEYTTSCLKTVIEDSYNRLIAPAIEREIRNSLTDMAEDGAMKPSFWLIYFAASASRGSVAL